MQQLLWYAVFSRNAGESALRDEINDSCEGEVVFRNPVHPNIIMQILHTVLHTCLKTLTWRICFVTIERLVSWWSFPFFLWPLYFISWMILLREIRCLSLLLGLSVKLHENQSRFAAPMKVLRIFWRKVTLTVKIL